MNAWFYAFIVTYYLLLESAAASLEPGYNDGSNVYVRFPGMEAEVERLRSELLVSSRDISNRLQRAGTQLRNGKPNKSSLSSVTCAFDACVSVSRLSTLSG